ncbi:hypothetical protein M3Y99_01671800 [Aphelenchoides fujianensis]|nr:hypothetical protein M3Y99_01671800 [Aphelenchoides fujianensis]
MALPRWDSRLLGLLLVVGVGGCYRSVSKYEKSPSMEKGDGRLGFRFWCILYPLLSTLLPFGYVLPTGGVFGEKLRRRWVPFLKNLCTIFLHLALPLIPGYWLALSPMPPLAVVLIAVGSVLNGAALRQLPLLFVDSGDGILERR